MKDSSFCSLNVTQPANFDTIVTQGSSQVEMFMIPRMDEG